MWVFLLESRKCKGYSYCQPLAHNISHKYWKQCVQALRLCEFSLPYCKSVYYRYIRAYKKGVQGVPEDPVHGGGH